MATNMNLPRKQNLVLGEYTNMPIAGTNDYNMSMNRNTSPNFPSMPSSNNAIGTANDSAMGNPGHNQFPQNHFNQGMNNFTPQSRQYQESLENMARPKFSPNSNMAAAPYSGVYDSNSSGGYQFAMARMQGKFRPPDMFNMNKNVEQSSYTQQRNMGRNPWSVEYSIRNNSRRSLPVKTTMSQQVLVDPNRGHNMLAEQNFPSPGTGGSSQQPFPMQSPYMASDMYKQTRTVAEQQFTARGMASNFHPQDFYQKEQMRQMANQYQQSPLPHAVSNYLPSSQRNSPKPFVQPVLPKASPEALYTQQFSASPKSNGPHPMMNILDERQVPYTNSNYPVSPVGSQMAAKPGYAPALGMRGTVSPNVTIGMPKKPYRPQEEAVTSPGSNQNAAAAAAAAAVLAAAVNTANPHTSPQSAGDIHITSRPPSVPNIPSRPPSIHSKEPGARSPATSIISDHKSESGGSGINDIRRTPSPARSMSRNTPQLPDSTVINFSSDVETGRVPSPSVNQLQSSDIEAMIQSVSNIPGNAVLSTEQSSQIGKHDPHSEETPRANTRSEVSPVTPPSPFSLSPSINVDFDIDMLSPSWEDSASRSATPLSKLYKISDKPERKEFLNKLVSCMEQQGKSLNEVPNFNGYILDLFKFHQLVLKRGGMQEVTRLNLWKEVVQGLTNGGPTANNGVDEQILREHYIRYLLPYEEKLGGPPLPQPSSMPVTIAPPTSTPSSIPTASPAEPGNIDLSTLTYKNLSMFQPNTPNIPYSQGNTSQATMQPPSYPNTPPSTQGYPSTSPMQQHPGYRNIPQAPPGYHGYPQGSSRVPSYPSGHPGYSNHQYPGFPGAPSQMPGFHNGITPPRYPSYPGPRGAAPPEVMYMRDGQFPRGPAVGVNKPFQHMNDAQPQGMYPNYPPQGQQPTGYMYQQQASNMATYQMERQRTAHGQRGGMGSPRPRMQTPWGQRYQESGTGISSGSPSPFHNSQSPGLKPPNTRPPPPYPHPKTEKPSPTPQSAAAALQYQAMKSGGVKFSSGVKKEEDIFPAGCVETTQAMHTKKRRLTARDIGPVEAWRIMMSLKSGLLSETAWALDTLTILLSDDVTVGFFRLADLPGFLDTVVEHFRRNLINVFNVFEESEIDTGVPKCLKYGNTKDNDENETFSDVLPDLIATENLSSLIVAQCLTDKGDGGFCSGVKDWSEGGGDTTIHIQTHFQTDPPFYEGMKVKTAEGDRREDPDKVQSTDESSVLKASNRKEKDSQDCNDSEDMDQGKNNVTKDREELKEHSGVQVEVNSIFNGIPSPDTKRQRRSVITTDSGLSLKTKPEILDWGMKQNCCNREKEVENNCECLPTKVEPGTCIKEDPSAVLIKRLKTELDLDIESVGDDTEDVTSSTPSRDMRIASPSESECELKQEFPLSSVTFSQDSAISSCNCVSNIIRNLSFVPGNDVEMAKHPSLLLILAKLLLLHHYKRKSSLDCQYNDSNCWWQDCLDIVRENTLVTVANIAGYLDLSLLAGNVSRGLLDGLLHWLVCQSSIADEPLRSTSISVSLTPKQLVLETLAKMSVLETNVDCILSSPDKERLRKAYEYLVKLFSDKTNEVTREFALVLLSSFTQANEQICTTCSERNLVTVLVGFLEDARDRVESMAVRGLHPGMFRDNDLRVSMGMLRRAGGLMACIAKRTRSTHLIPFQERILALSMSRALDAEVQSHLSNVLYNLPR